MYIDFFKNYFNKNKKIVIADSILTLLVFPIEIIIVSWITGMIFVSIKNKNLTKFWFYLGLFFVIFFIILIIYYITEYFDSIILPELQASIREDIYENITDGRMGSNNIKNGELITKILKIPNNIFLNYINFTTYMLPLFFGILFFVGYLFFLDWRIGIYSLIFFTIFIIGFIYYYLYICNITNNRFFLEGKLMNTYEDILKNNENILLNNSKNFEKNIYIDTEKIYKKAQAQELRNINNFKMTFMVLLSIFICFLIIYSSYLVIKNKMTLTILIILTTASILMLKSFTSLIRRCAESIVEFGPTLKDNNFFKSIQQNYIHFGRKTNFFNKFEIQIKNIEFNINDKIILKNLSLNIFFKDSILIKGNIGVGKSTLLRILIGYIKPTKGDVYFDNIHLNDIDITYLRKYVTIMHQNVILFNRSVLENILYGIEKDSLEWNRKYQQLKQMKLFPYLETFIEQKDATKLSGGQKQIVLLLRCYFKNTKILLLDEPTANIDFETKQIVYDLIQQFIKEITVICVSHDSNIDYLFKKIYFLKNGKLFLQ